MATLLIKEDKLKSMTYISDNVDAKVITPNIEYCQDVYIQPLLSSMLYKDIIAAIEADITLSNNSAYKTLLDDYIHKALAWYVMSEIGDATTYKVANKAVSKMNGDNTQPASMEELIRLNQKYKDRAEYYGQRLRKFLLANLDTYPLYLQSNEGVDRIPPKSTAYNTGIYLGPTVDRDRQGRPFGPDYGYYREQE